MTGNPYQPLDDIYDLLLALIPDKETALGCAQRAGLSGRALDLSLDLADFLRDIVSTAHWHNCMRELLSEVGALYPEQADALAAASAAYEAALPPNPRAEPSVNPDDPLPGAEEAVSIVGDDGGRDLPTAADGPETGDTLAGHVEGLVPSTDLGTIELPESGSGWHASETAVMPGNGGSGETLAEPVTGDGAPAPPVTVNGGETPTPLPATNGGSGEQVQTLRLDTAVPRSVTVGEAFQLAVAVRQSNAPLLAREDLPVVDSGDVQVLWPAGAAFITLRTQISAPDCTIEGPDSDTFKLFAGRDSPVFLYHLAPQRTGAISIYVAVYQEQDRLGTAGVMTKARAHRRTTRPRVAGGVEIAMQSLSLAPQGSLAALEPLHDLFVELFGRDRDAPRILAEQAGLDVSLIPYSAINADYLWNVLVEAHQRRAIPALIEQAIERKVEREVDLRAGLGKYEQLVIGDR